MLEDAQGRANERLIEDEAVRAYETTMEFARSQGAIALFGEKYGDVVRVVEIGDYSVELCGGTHTARTGQVAPIIVVSEGSIGSGLRRIEALVGPDALRWVETERHILEEVAQVLGSGDPRQAPDRARRAMARIKELEGELRKLRKDERGERVGQLVDGARDVVGVRLVVAEIPGEDVGGLRELAMTIRDRLAGNGAVVLGTSDGSKAQLVAAVTPDLVDRGVTAPALLEVGAKAIGGGAGGKPHLAIAGGGRPDGLAEALAGIPERLAALLDSAS
jgi:alanyl-tRNA synthetase